MGETPGPHLSEEPQSVRGPVGSRDSGADEPAGGPVDRSAATTQRDADSSVHREEPQSPDAPHLPTGDAGG